MSKIVIHPIIFLVACITFFITFAAVFVWMDFWENWWCDVDVFL